MKKQELEEHVDLDDSDEEPEDLIIENFEERDSYSKQPSVDCNISDLKNLVINLIKNTPEGVTSVRDVKLRL